MHDYALTDFWTMTPPQRETVLLEAIAEAHARHCARNRAYRQTVAARGVGPSLDSTKDRTRYTFYPHMQAVPFNAGPRLLNRTHSITADVEIPSGGVQGALVSFEGVDGGYSFYVKDNKL